MWSSSNRRRMHGGSSVPLDLPGHGVSDASASVGDRGRRPFPTSQNGRQSSNAPVPRNGNRAMRKSVQPYGTSVISRSGPVVSVVGAGIGPAA